MVPNYAHWLTDFIFIALFRDTPLATIGHPWPDGQMAINGQKWSKWEGKVLEQKQKQF